MALLAVHFFSFPHGSFAASYTILSQLESLSICVPKPIMVPRKDSSFIYDKETARYSFSIVQDVYTNKSISGQGGDGIALKFVHIFHSTKSLTLCQFMLCSTAATALIGNLLLVVLPST